MELLRQKNQWIFKLHLILIDNESPFKNNEINQLLKCHSSPLSLRFTKIWLLF